MQGYTEADAKKNPFGAGNDRKADMEALVAYVTSESRGIKMNVAAVAPEGARGLSRSARRCSSSAAARTTSRARRATARTASASACRTCPTSPTKAGAQKAYTTWPAYRVSQGELRSFQWRLNDCFRQQRFPELVFASRCVDRPHDVPRRKRQRRARSTLRRSSAEHDDDETLHCMVRRRRGGRVACRLRDGAVGCARRAPRRRR